MKKCFLFLFTLNCFFISCTNKNKIPRDVLSKKKMESVMWDLTRADLFVSDFVMKDSSLNRKEESVKLYETIFQLHNTSRKQFETSLSFYESRPDIFKEVLDSLNATARLAEQNAYKPREKVDSLSSDTTSPSRARPPKAILRRDSLLKNAQ